MRPPGCDRGLGHSERKLQGASGWDASFIYDMNVGRPTGDLVASPDAVLANFLLTYARRAGACPPGTTAQLAEEEAAAASS